MTHRRWRDSFALLLQPSVSLAGVSRRLRNAWIAASASRATLERPNEPHARPDWLHLSTRDPPKNGNCRFQELLRRARPTADVTGPQARPRSASPATASRCASLSPERMMFASLPPMPQLPASRRSGSSLTSSSSGQRWAHSAGSAGTLHHNGLFHVGRGSQREH
jgi:hypothetical protein